MTILNICNEQSCNEKVRRGHHLCRAHWEKFQEGVIDECPQCGVYKDVGYPFCVECNKKTNAVRRKKSKQAEDKQQIRRYDPVRADTFDKRAALLEDDPKAKDKRLLFDQQQEGCIYCGNVYPYDQLQIEHMIPKAKGGSDNIRNAQLACGICNRAKGTMTDIEFRRKHARYLPQIEKKPADPPIDPELLKPRGLTGQTKTTKPGVVRETHSGHAAAYCVRCARSIDFDDEKPLCGDCYRVWSRYKDLDYEENYCHACGEEKSTTFLKPFCRPCFKKHFD